MHCQSEILSSHGNLDWNLKENKNKLIKTNQYQDDVYGWPSYSELIIITAVELFFPK